MEVILCETIPSLGKEGEVIKVKDGYARNFLIPQGYALYATSVSAADITHKQKMLKDRRMRQIKTEQDLANAISGVELLVRVKVGEEDRVFGSVTNKDISKALAAKGFEVDRRKVILEEPIRALGEYTVNVRFSGDIEAKVRVRVDKE
jgi:large subunit ribosomal protein L9